MTGTAADMVAMLRRHYLPDESRPGGIFAAEIEAPGRSGRRADLIWQGVTAASGHELVGHEIKVTRADVLVELADPSKSDPWQRYCDRWWLVVADPALIDGLELPPTWGVLGPPSGRRTRSCTVVRPAPRLDPPEKGPALFRLATRLHWDLSHARTDVRQQTDRVQRLHRETERLRQNVETRTPSPTQEVVARIVRELGGVPHGDQVGDYQSGHVDPDAVVAALRDVQSANRAALEADRRRDHAMHDIQRAHDGLARFLADQRAAPARLTTTIDPKET